MIRDGVRNGTAGAHIGDGDKCGAACECVEILLGESLHVRHLIHCKLSASLDTESNERVQITSRVVIGAPQVFAIPWITATLVT